MLISACCSFASCTLAAAYMHELCMCAPVQTAQVFLRTAREQYAHAVNPKSLGTLSRNRVRILANLTGPCLPAANTTVIMFLLVFGFGGVVGLHL
mmetsp:Transcript_19487/g.54153  ORF Transcript_19487/g.54153 Transcript_19487/m.54153 type:complete len:95 (+) Transcript_19487:653-937(+)